MVPAYLHNASHDFRIRNNKVCPNRSDFWLPIHPTVGRSLGLPFASAEKRWPIYHLQLTHREYIMCYMACRTNNVPDFLTFLKNLSSEALHAATASMSGKR